MTFQAYPHPLFYISACETEPFTLRENYPTTVVIDSAEVAATQKIVFDTLWGLL
ncbi:hypothetical protein [Pontibacterium sp.]|uniref:hypothetical protein n=1 Tax=Pontibacterium sp. TaxID=2036026 RepID=UPI003567A848